MHKINLLNSLYIAGILESVEHVANLSNEAKVVLLEGKIAKESNKDEVFT